MKKKTKPGEMFNKFTKKKLSYHAQAQKFISSAKAKGYKVSAEKNEIIASPSKTKTSGSPNSPTNYGKAMAGATKAGGSNGIGVGGVYNKKKKKKMKGKKVKKKICVSCGK